jgi:hypothetical protein
MNLDTVDYQQKEFYDDDWKETTMAIDCDGNVKKIVAACSYRLTIINTHGEEAVVNSSIHPKFQKNFFFKFTIE